MHILILEASLTGHHSGYLEHIVDSYMSIGHEVSVAVLQRDISHPAICRLKNKYVSDFYLTSIDIRKNQDVFHSPLGAVFRELTFRRVFGKTYRSINKTKTVDYVFLPYVDYCLYGIGLLGSPFGSTKWGGICMRPSFHYTHYDVIAPKTSLKKLKKYFFFRTLRSQTLKSLYTIDFLLHKFVINQSQSYVNKLKYFPDPSDLRVHCTYQDARRKLGISNSSIVILIYGALDERKGLDVIFESLSKPMVSERYHLLIVGIQADSLKLYVNTSEFNDFKNKNRCTIIDDFVDSEMQDVVFAASDIVWLGYRNHYSMSSVLVHAGLASKPVISTTEGLLGWYTKNNNLGEVFDINDTLSLVSALRLMMITENRNICGANASKVFERHKWSCALKIILK